MQSLFDYNNYPVRLTSGKGAQLLIVVLNPLGNPEYLIRFLNH